MNDKLRKIYDDCRHYGAVTYRTDFPTDNGYLTIIMFDYDNHIYTFKMFNGEILDMMKDWKEFLKWEKMLQKDFLNAPNVVRYWPHIKNQADEQVQTILNICTVTSVKRYAPLFSCQDICNSYKIRRRSLYIMPVDFCGEIMYNNNVR